MRLIIVRHGETIENIKGTSMGHLPGKLSKKGKEQAKKVALRLKNEKIDYIYSSDLARAADTAKEIAKFHKNAPISFVKELRERNLGVFQGKKRKKHLLNEKTWKRLNNRPKNGETMAEMFIRAKKFYNKVFRKHKKDNILFVCHNGIKKMLVCAITKKRAKGFFDIQSFDNTSVSIFEIDEQKNHKIHVYNCTKHLKK